MDEMPRDGFRHRPRWLLAVAALVCAQAGFALAVFGADRSPSGVLDDRPIVSGRHPLHLYHGSLGAENFWRIGSTTCFDPNFQAGYPKTPAFDSGCRPAECFLTLGGGVYSPRAYKLGVFCCLLLIPVGFVAAARGVGLPAGAAVLTGIIGTMLGWSPPVRRMLDEGELDYLVAGLGAVVYVAWLVRYTRYFDIESWFVLAGVSVVGWYAHPVVWLGLAPVIAGYYLVYAPRRELAWHLGLLGILAAGIAPNLWWLADWSRYWWLPRHSLDQVALPNWQVVLGSPPEYFSFIRSVPFGIAMVAASTLGLVALWRSGCRCGAGLVILATGLAVLAARVMATWPHMTLEGPEHLAPLALGLLALPAAFGFWTLLQRAQCAALGTVLAVSALLFAGWCDGPDRPFARAAFLQTEPLVLGLRTDQVAIVEFLKQRTTPEARILWDDTADLRSGWNWSALLPRLTDRAFLGGLDRDAGMDYSFCEMRDGLLNGRRLAEWTDAELEDYCRWYNVGWVVCRSSAAFDRWSRLPMAKPIGNLNGGQAVTVFELDRPRTYILSGQATWEACGPNRVTLTNVAPDANGFVYLSLHFPAAGLRAYPSYVQVITIKDKSDPMSHVCLMPHGPVPRVTLVWENP